MPRNGPRLCSAVCSSFSLLRSLQFFERQPEIVLDRIGRKGRLKDRLKLGGELLKLMFQNLGERVESLPAPPSY